MTRQRKESVQDKTRVLGNGRKLKRLRDDENEVIPRPAKQPSSTYKPDAAGRWTARRLTGTPAPDPRNTKRSVHPPLSRTMHGYRRWAKMKVGIMNNVGIHPPSLSGPASGVATYGLESAWPPLAPLVVQPLCHLGSSGSSRPADGEAVKGRLICACPMDGITSQGSPRQSGVDELWRRTVHESKERSP